jgi:hypothetical protein
MDVFLTEPELLREKNLFAPHEEIYAILDGVALDLNAFTELSDDENAPQIPSSC